MKSDVEIFREIDFPHQKDRVKRKTSAVLCGGKEIVVSKGQEDFGELLSRELGKAPELEIPTHRN